MHGEAALGELVEDFIGRPLRLYVYNNEYDVTREVTITPSRDWGGQGAMGCVLGYGALHRLPAPLSEPVNAPGEMLFDGGMNEKNGDAAFEQVAGQQPSVGADYLVPAQMVESTPISAPPKGGKKKDKHGASPNKMMDDYFKEEEEKSREVDNAPQSKSAGVPPPPKAGAGPPPKAKAQEKSTEEDK